ncbi:hypothetical protein QFC21_004346 [Naganishia friedmannii]|uniref:Uncharacterized protein n=1 Tax=Naganishia friedmannii TaxID=89922 RepID=A0ACC2VHT9_9TREE|nr:hypothetical protein QFC21_004346 [Naganishia friedmannii]
MNDDLGPRGQKRILDDADPSDDVAQNNALKHTEDGQEQEQSGEQRALCDDTEKLGQHCYISVATEDGEVDPSTPLAGSSAPFGTIESTNMTEEHGSRSLTVGERLRKKIKTSITRQGSAPPRLELGFDSVSTSTSDVHSNTLAAQDHKEESMKTDETGTVEAIQHEGNEKLHSDERMEKLLDDLETESYQPSTRMAYTNPFPALTDYMRRMREIATVRYEDGYESSSSAGSEPMIRSGRATGQPHDDGSDGEDDYGPVNPYMRRARGDRSGMEVVEEEGEGAPVEAEDVTVRIGIHKTPKEGLKCPTCRSQPVVDVMGSCLVTSMVDLVNKHRPDLVRPANEIEQAHKVYKKGDKLSFPLPAASSMTNPSTGTTNRGAQLSFAVPALGQVLSPLPSHRSGRRSTNDHWTPCYHCAPLRNHESGDRYVCPEPPTRGCKIPKLAEIERLTASSSFTQIERLTSAIQIQEYSWASYRTAFQHNYYELANFILYCIKKNQAGSSANAGHQASLATADGTSSTAPRITMVDVIKATLTRDADAGGVRGVFERANKAWPMLEASIFEWWMKEAIKPEVASLLPPRQPDCKYGRNCAFQEDVNHTQSFSHLCERLPESEFTNSAQPTPSPETSVDAGIAQSPDALLRHAIIHSGPAFNLSSLTIEDLRWQDDQYSGVNASSRANARAMENAAVAGHAHHSDGESDHSDEEYGSREQTPASEIYREMGMESRAVQTEVPDGTERTRVLAVAYTGHEEPVTSVGRTVVDYDGEPMELEEDSHRTEEVLLPADSTDNASGESFVHASATSTTNNDILDLSSFKFESTRTYAPSQAEIGTDNSALPTTVSATAESINAVRPDNPSMSHRSLFEFPAFRFSSSTRYPPARPEGRMNNPAVSATIANAAGPSSANRAVSSHESMVEDLIVPPGGSGYSVLSFDENGTEGREDAALIAPGRTNEMGFQPHVQTGSQTDSVDSRRSSPEREAIMI